MLFAEAEIAEVAAQFACEFEREHVAFLQAENSCVLHACPGSGKTTLVVAKLALLAQKWRARDKGILVLSHTNAAREEVERRIATDPRASRLLAYPHYVGTIHGFINRFLALPFLRDVGLDGAPVDEPQIDDELFAQMAEKHFYSPGSLNRYRAARTYLERKSQEGRPIVRTLYYGLNGELASDGGRLPGSSTATGIQLRALKDLLSKYGVFRHSDMFSIARSSFARHSYLRAAIQTRFPWVFVDEVQDNSKEQEEFIAELFLGSDCIVQRVGDANQAIYSSDDGDSDRQLTHPNGSLDLPRSLRMAPQMARLVSPLAVVRPIAIMGNETRRDRGHTIFTFSDVTMPHVIDAFGERILEAWSDAGRVSLRAAAIGLRRAASPTEHRPGCISDYWCNFLQSPSPEGSSANALIGIVRHARTLVRVRGENWDAYRMLQTGIARVIERRERRRFTRRHLVEDCREKKIDEMALRTKLTRFLESDACTATPETWESHVADLRGMLGLPPDEPAISDYLGWLGDAVVDTTGSGTIYRHASAYGAIDIEVGTIHSAKGQTHDATLVLETYFNGHDLPFAIRMILGEQKLPIRGRPLHHLKRLFVACTRPRELLCLAVHRDHVTEEQLERLQTLGWHVRSVEESSASV